MSPIPWLRSNDDPELKKEAARNIFIVQQFPKEIPAGVITHDPMASSLVYMPDRGLIFSGVTPEKRQVSPEEIPMVMDACYERYFFHERYCNAGYAVHFAPGVIGLIERNNTDEPVSCYRPVRALPDHARIWHLSITKIFQRNYVGKHRLIITVALPVDNKFLIATKVEQLPVKNSQVRMQHHVNAALNRSEKEMLKRIAPGYRPQEIAGGLHISEASANIHNRDTRKKINARPAYNKTQFARGLHLN